jgi:predicted enzyme related to lactoylglutathione lyase
MPRPVHFEIPAEDPARAIKFYEEVFGWKFQKWDGPFPYWTVTTGSDSEPGINGGLMPRQNPTQPFANTIGIANLDETVAAITASGGKVAMPRMAVPGIGWMAYCIDTEGILFGLMQHDPAAK